MGEPLDYRNGAQTCEGYVALPAGTGRHPCILIAHQWAGISDFERARAEEFAELGYVGMAIDAYGKGLRGSLAADNSALMDPCMADRAALRQRLLAGVAAAKAHPRVDPQRIAAIGYCFGGTMALELARSGAAIAGVAGFHSGLGTALPQDAKNIKGKVLVCIGADDPGIPPEQRKAFEDEMRAGKVDWRMHLYGGVVHSFTNPDAGKLNQPDFARYDAEADRRSWAEMQSLFNEVFA